MPSPLAPHRPTTSPPVAVVVAGAAFVVMAGAQIAIPLTHERAGLTVVVVLGMAATTLAACTAAWGPGRAVLTAAVVVGATLLLEWVGHRTGWPFGSYDYTGSLRPEVLGVPVVVPLAWFGMGVPAREVAARLSASRAARVPLGAVALTAWDLMLDPQMVEEGFWRWGPGGVWRTVPLSNYVGWLVSAAVLMAALEALLPPRRHGDTWPLLALYTWMAGMTTIGFVAFFGDPVVGVVGGLAMCPLAALAWRRTASGADG